MGSGKPGRRHQRKTSAGRPSSSPALSENAVTDLPIGAELYEKHRLELENLTLATQPLKTLKLSSLAAVQYTKSVLYAFTKHGWFMILGTLIMACGVLFVAVQGPHNKHVRELFCYIRFVLWWTALGVASSIGLGSGLHTFVLYLGPHIALFTIKAMNCGRVDLKTALYDTIQLKSGPSWLDKDCSEFGPPLFFSSPNSLVKVPLSSILPQVQFEAILWGFGTAIGELPPYFISKAAHMSGSKLDAVEELEFSPKQTGIISGRLKEIKCWLFSHSQHLNFFTVLVLASVPNPLFDLAGIMCGQFGIPFWKFFFATLIGKAIIKTHIQTIFIISVCNNQLLEWIESELIWVFSLFPGLSSYLANVIAKLHKMREKFVSPVPVRTNMKGKQWGISFSGIWNAVIWLMLMNFFVKIVNATAQKQLNQQRERVVKTAERLKTIQRS